MPVLGARLCSSQPLTEVVEELERDRRRGSRLAQFGSQLKQRYYLRPLFRIPRRDVHRLATPFHRVEALFEDQRKRRLLQCVTSPSVRR